MQTPNRRHWIQLSSGLVVAAMAGAPRAYAGQQKAAIQEEEKDIIFRTTDPRNGEPELPNLVGDWMTPTKHFYVRSHAPNPVIDPQQFRVAIDGMVRKPMELSFGDLSKFTRHETIATLTCAGNRRAEFNAEGKVGGVQWGAGAIGNASWSGFALADVLKQVEIMEGASHVWFEGLDQIERKGGIIPFGGSIPLSRAMEVGTSTVLLADQMNGEALTADHGYPLRTVVPGYIGARSVKWLGKITVSDRPSPNHYVATAYKIVKKTEPLDWIESGPIYRFPINAALCSFQKLDDGKVKLMGYALPSGRSGSAIKSVSISPDGGKSWVRATLDSEPKDFCWAFWSATMKIGAGVETLHVRADDTSGDFMPYRVPWNAKGYLQNSWFKHSLAE